MAHDTTAVKTCSRCREELTEANAPPSVRRKGGYCRRCNYDYMARYFGTKPCTKCGATVWGKSITCRSCLTEERNPTGPCVVCGEATRKPSGCCSRACADKYRYDHAKERRFKAERACGWCLMPFRPVRDQTLLCSTECKWRLKQQMSTWHAPDRCHLPICRDCRMPYPWAGGQTERCPACSALWRRKRKTTGGIGDRIDHRALWERDGGRCHLCGKAVKWEAVGGRAPSIDHLIPIAHDGEHTWENVALAHVACNSRRRDVGPAQLRLLA